MQNNTEVYDITIIGGGPTGLFAAFYSGMRQLKVKIIDSLPHLGGQLSALYPEKYIYDVAGFPKIRAQVLVDQLKSQAMQFNPTVVLGQAVEDVVKMNDGNFQVISDQEVHYSKTILITAGIGAFEPRRVPLEHAKKYEGQNIHYYINDLAYFSNQEVCLLGGGDSAVDWALMLEPIAKKIHIIHRREQFRAHESSVKKMEDSSINILKPYQLVDINGDGRKIHSINIKNNNTHQTETLGLNELIVNFGFVSSLGPIKKWGLDLQKNSIVVDSKMRTNIEGIFAAGDIVTYDGKVKLLATGFGDAPTAVNNAKAYLDPKAKIQPKHSTSVFS